MKNSLPQPDAPLPKGLLQHLPNGSAQSSGEVAAVAETKKKTKSDGMEGIEARHEEALGTAGPRYLRKQCGVSDLLCT